MRLGIVSDDQQPGGRAGSGQVISKMRLGCQGAMSQVSLSGLMGTTGGSRAGHFRGGLSNFFRKTFRQTDDTQSLAGGFSLINV